MLRRLLARIGRFKSAAISTLLYLVLWVPAGLLSMLAADWLRRRAPRESNWRPRPDRVNQPESLRAPF